MAGLVAAVLTSPRPGTALFQTHGDRLRIGIVRSAGSISLRKGISLGLEEIGRPAMMFKKAIDLYTSDLDQTTNIRSMVASLARKSVPVVIADANATVLLQLAAECTQNGIALFNCGSRSDRARRTLCGGTTFHIEASDAMYRSARAQSPRAKSIVLWDARLERYGAAQLNDRFRAFTEATMDGPAWAGWMAVKIAWEAFLRSPESFRSQLTSEKTQFDGHKGAPLSFRKWDHQLRQPLFAVSDRIADVPDIGRASGSIQEILDTLGDRAGVQSCVST